MSKSSEKRGVAYEVIWSEKEIVISDMDQMEEGQCGYEWPEIVLSERDIRALRLLIDVLFAGEELDL
jgi:hypothetical protein